jgi:hypothetical membrane protein
VRRTATARWAAACWITAGCGYMILEALAANGFRSDYRYSANFISDLGRPDLNASAPLMNAAFYLQGTLFLVAAQLVGRAQRSGSAKPFVALAAANALGNIVVGTIHSGGHWQHDAGAVLAIVGGNAAILAGSAALRGAGAPQWYRTVSVALATLGLAAFAALAVQPMADTAFAPNAVLERISVYTIIAWQLFSAFHLRANWGTLSPWQPRTRGARTTPRS